MRIGISVAVAVWMLAVLNPLYLRMKRGPHRAAAIAVKAACTLSAAGLCLVGCLRGGEAADWWLLAGLLFCTLGDVPAFCGRDGRLPDGAPGLYRRFPAAGAS